MRRWLQSHYDFTIIDCPPSVAIQVRIFLTIATGYVLPTVPDRLSVRGSLYLLDRIRRAGVKLQGVGTLWSLYRQQNAMHRKLIAQTAQGLEPFNQLPRPFQTVIPNAAAIAEATEPGRQPKSFNAKYTPQFGKLYRSLCDEIVKRCEWERSAPEPEELSATA